MGFWKAARRLALAGLACVAYGTFVESKLYQVRRVKLPVLPPKSEPIRLLHISDAHLLDRDRRAVEFIKSLAGLEPDIVVATGDMISEAESIPVLADALGRLLEKPGVFTLGSSDYLKPRAVNPFKYLRERGQRRLLQADLPTGELVAALEAGGWVNVEGKDTVLDVCGVKLEFRGTGDAHIGLDDYPKVAGKRKRGAKLLIGVTHAPYRRVLDAMTADGVELILTGHTHGGQVCVPFLGALTTNCDLDPSQAKGVSVWEAGGERAWLHVSAGFGTSPYAPFRFACPPEVTLLTLAHQGGPED